jgi:hypothetical protein
MHETPDDVRRLQSVLDTTYAAAGRHLRSVITPDPRLTAEQVADLLQGMCLLALATLMAEGRRLVDASTASRPDLAPEHCPAENCRWSGLMSAV